MPYKVFKRDGKFKVFKLDEDGNPTGEALGTHDTQASAARQVRAAYANEKKEYGEMEGGEDMAVMMAQPVTFAELAEIEAAYEAGEEVSELTGQFSMLACNIMASDVPDKPGALQALAAEYAGLVSATMTKPAEEKESLLARAIHWLKGKPEPEPVIEPPKPESHNISIWKEGGQYRWLAAYSNNRRDDDNPPEIIASESHKAFNEALERKEFPMPELWLWHIPVKVGSTLFHAYDESTGFPMAGGVFDIGKEWVAEGLIKAGWDGVSHGMPVEYIKRSPEDPTIITRHVTREISILPNWAAANKLSFSVISKESKMKDEKGLPQHKRAELAAVFGEDKAALFEQAVSEQAKEADSAGVEKKEANPLTRDEVATGLAVIMDAIKSFEGKIDARLSALETKATEPQYDLVEMLKAKSAIGNPATKLRANSELAKDAPEETESKSATAGELGVPIGLLDRLFASNQQWGGKL